jgi:hypothetical protein
MPLSTNGLQEGDFTTLRVLKNGVLQDVLSLTSSGSPDIPLGSLSIALVAGLQAQLGLKASTSALNATTASIGADIDGLEVSLGAVGSSVGALGSLVEGVVGAVATKAAQSDLVKTDAALSTLSGNFLNVAASLATNLSTVSAQLATRASAVDVESLTRKYDAKQDLIDESLTMGSGLFQISTEGNTFSIMRKIGGVYIALLILQYNESLNLTRVIAPGELRPGSIGGLQDLTINNTLTVRDAIVSSLIVDALSATVCANVGNNEGYMITRDGNQLDSYYQRSQTGSTLFLCRNTRFPVQCGTSLYVGDISFSDDAATHQLAVAGKAIISEGLKTTSVDAESLTVNTPSVGTNSVTTADIGSSFSYFRFVHGHHLDCYTRGSNSGRVLYLNYYANSGVRIKSLGINADPASDVNLNVTGSSRFSGTVYAGAVSAGATTIDSLDDEVPFIAGNVNGFMRLKNGEHIDCYSRATGAGITLNLCMHTDSAVRVGKRLVIATSPITSYSLDVGGSGRFSGSLSAANYPSSSDARLKDNVLDASTKECERILLAVRPKTYTRNDLNDASRIGYIAQDLDAVLRDGYRSILSKGENADGPLLQLDYSRLVPVLHGALLSCLARIEALESRLQ